MKLHFAHIINTVSPADNASLERVQANTMKTMVVASESAKNKVVVDLLSAQYEDARNFLPAEIKATTDLTTSAADQKELGTNKRLPLIREILSRLEESSDATHFIYTNLDICLMPFFYESVAGYIEKGHDAMVINRRRISDSFIEEKNLSEAFAESGKKHPGFDCFVFSRALLKKFVLKDIYISTPPAGTDLFHNIFAFGENPVLLTDKHLTFHIGMELVKDWGSPLLNKHNQSEFSKMLKELKPHIDIAKFPGSEYYLLKRHFKWLMNPGLHYPTLASIDFKQFSRKRKSIPKSETPGMRNRYLEWLFRVTGF